MTTPNRSSDHRVFAKVLNITSLSSDWNTVKLFNHFSTRGFVETDMTVIASGGDLLSISREGESKDGAVVGLDLCDTLPVFGFENSYLSVEG